MNNCIDVLLENVKNKLSDNFENKLLFFGIQGSYARGEETCQSDIDLVVILSELNFEDLKTYKNILNSFPEKDKFCGFISGKKEIKNWSKQDIFQFYYDTKPVFGNLADIINPPALKDVHVFMKISAGNLYHSAIHSYLHSAQAVENLASLYKMAFFILQAKYYIEKAVYIPTQKELLPLLNGEDREILTICINMQEQSPDLLYSKIISWSGSIVGHS